MATFTDIPWEKMRSRHQHIQEQLVLPSLENAERLKLQKEAAQLSKLLNAYDTLLTLEKEKEELELQDNHAQGDELKALFSYEIAAVQTKIAQAEKELEFLLFPPSEIDNQSVFLEIRAGAGGQEAALFAMDLARMYLLYAQKMGWHASVVSTAETDLGGCREIVLSIEGKNIYGHLKWESGVHRVQRVPKTETAGRVHTSTVTVAVLPDVEEETIHISPADLRIDTYRAGGAGGQHVNKTESAVRITHIPTGTVVACQDERSQHKNKAKAMKVLQARIFAAQQEKQSAEMGQKRREQVGTGERAEKVRTYNYPQNRVTDHQVDLTLKNLDMVMEGNLNEIIDALMEKNRLDRRRERSSLLIT